MQYAITITVPSVMGRADSLTVNINKVRAEFLRHL